MTSFAPLRPHLAALALPLLLLSISCDEALVGKNGVDGGDTDDSFELAAGFYQVTEHRLNADGCDMPEEEVSDGQPLFEIYEDTVGVVDYLFIHSCASQTDCGDAGEHFFVGQFLRPEGDELYRGSAYASLQATPCRLIALDAEVRPLADDGIGLDLRRRELETGLPESDCTPAEAESRQADLVCIERRLVEGVPLP